MRERMADIRFIHREYTSFYQIGGWVIIFLAGLGFGFVLFGGDNPLIATSGNTLNYLTNAFTEIVAVVAIILTLNHLNQQRAAKALTLQDILVAQAGSKTRAVAADAIHELSKRSGLYRDALVEADLKDVDLSGVHLDSANLQDANLMSANLKGAWLRVANLERAELSYTDCQKADLRSVILKEAGMWNTFLQGANLSGANLHRAEVGHIFCEGANLMNAWLRNVEDIELAHFDETTILPDAQIIGKDEHRNPIYDKFWTPDTDMLRYIDPEHPDFWEPQWAIDGYNRFWNWYEDTILAQPNDS